MLEIEARSARLDAVVDLELRTGLPEVIEALSAKLNPIEVAKPISAMLLGLERFEVDGVQGSLKAVEIDGKDEDGLGKRLVLAKKARARQAKGYFLGGQQPQEVGVEVVFLPSSLSRSKANSSLHCCSVQIEVHAQTTLSPRHTFEHSTLPSHASKRLPLLLAAVGLLTGQQVIAVKAPK